nr:hypothetical protein [Tanacetum cinerariifolium]
MQTQTSNTLHNAIMEADGKDYPPMLAPGNYVQWKSIIKRYIDTKLNHELIHYCLKNPPYKFTWADKVVRVTEGSSVTTTKRYMENYKNVSQDIRDQLNAEAEAIQIILTGIDNDIYSTVDACPNAFEMWKAIERLKQGESINVQDLETNLYWEFGKFTSRDGKSLESYYSRSQQATTRNRGKAIVNSPLPIYDQEPSMVVEDDEMSKDKEIDKIMALISLSFKKIYKPTKNNLRTSSNTSRANQDNSPRIIKGTGYDNQRIGNVAGARETVGTIVVQKSGIQCYICKEFGHVARECQKPKRVKDAAYHKEKMLLCKQEEAGFQLNAEQADWRADTDDEPQDQELEAYYMYMARIQEVTPDAVDDSGPIFNTEPLQKVQNNDHYNVFAIESEHSKQSKSVNDTYPIEQDEHNVIIDSLDMSYDREQIDQNDDDDDLSNEHDLLASLIEKLKCKIDGSKKHNKFLKASNKVLVDKLKGEIEDFKTKNKSLESSNNRFKEANNELSKPNELMYKDPKKFQAELDRRNVVKYMSKVETDVIPLTSVSRPQLKSNPMEDRVMLNNSQRKKQEVEDHCRNVKFSKNKTSVTPCYDSLNAKTLNVNFVCATCGKCVLNEKHEMCVLKSLNCVNSRPKMPIDVPISSKEPKRIVNQSVAKSLRKIIDSESTNQKPRNTTRKLYEHVSKTCSWWYPKFTPLAYNWKPKSQIGNVNPNVSMPLGNASRTANILEHMTSRRSTRSNTPLSSNSFAARIDNPIHRRLWLNHSLFSVGQFCDADLEVAFQKSTCYIRDLKGNDLLIGSHGTDFYSITLQDTSSPNLICLMAKATSSQAWLWHHRLSHLNFDTINLLLKNDIVIDLPKLKFVKDHLCSSCGLGKAKQKSFQTKTTPSSKRRLQLLHMDLCGPMRVESINAKKYVLVIMDDYSIYTWTHFLRSKDETPEVLIDFLRLVQRGLHSQVRIVRTDKGMEFLNKTLHAYFASEGINHQTSIARTPKQNGVVKRRNRILVEAARTMLSAAKVPLFFWAEAIATTCFTQNHSLVIPRHEKIPYHIINDRKSSVKFFHIFGSLCYIVRDGENLDKIKEKGDACIFVGMLGVLYTGDFCCSKGNVEDKILVPKPPKNYARCAKCGHPVNGPYRQGCALLREKLKEDLVSYFQNFQNISKSSDDSTNVVNAPRESYVVKQDNGSFVDKI